MGSNKRMLCYFLEPQGCKRQFNTDVFLQTLNFPSFCVCLGVKTHNMADCQAIAKTKQEIAHFEAKKVLGLPF
jgi:hypothetical protein